MAWSAAPTDHDHGMHALEHPCGPWIAACGQGTRLPERSGLYRLALVITGCDRFADITILAGGSWLVSPEVDQPRGSAQRMWIDFGLGADPRRGLPVSLDAAATAGPVAPGPRTVWGHDLPVRVPSPAQTCARALMPHLLARLRSGLPVARLQAHNDLDSLLIEIVALALVENPLPLSDRLARAELAAHLGLDQNPGIADLAAAAGLSRSAFHVAWRQCRTGSPGAWLARLRLETAQRLLATTSLPVAVVARHSGFGDASAFARAFHRATGQPPARWRQQARQDQGLPVVERRP